MEKINYVEKEVSAALLWDSTSDVSQKMMIKGADNLTLPELFGIVFGKKQSAASKRLLGITGSMLSLFKRDKAELFEMTNPELANKILAFKELFKRTQMESAPAITQIYSSESVAKLMSPVLKDLPNEECWVIYLNRGNRVLLKERLTMGGVNSTVLDVKMIIKRAFQLLANSIILVHNHPSGSKMPGDQDKLQTRRLKNTCEVCDMTLLDHVIIAGDNYYSFADDGIL